MPRILVALLSLVLSTLALAQDSGSDPVAWEEKIPTLIVGGANNHDWQWTHESLRGILEETGRFDVTITTEPGDTLANAEELAKYEVLVLDYNGPRWGEAAEQAFVEAVRGGLGVVVVHAANNAFRDWKEYEEICMLLWRKGTGHGRFHPFDVSVIDREHPVTAGMPDMRMHADELYHRLVNSQGTEPRILAHAMSSKESGGTGENEPMMMVRTYGEGRVFHTPLGHVWKNVPASRVSHRDPQFRRMLARGTEWAATGTCQLSPTPPNWVSPEESELGFVRIFDGHSTDGWRSYGSESFPEQGWSVEDGALVHAAKGGGGDLVTAKAYADFELRFEWAVGERSNSGVIYRVGEDEPASYHTGPEYQVLDDAGFGVDGDGLTSTGSLYGLVQPIGKQLNPAGRWNTGRIVVRGWRVEHWVNGVKVVDADLGTDSMRERIATTKFAQWPFAQLDAGHIALQDHGDAVRYRSLRIRTFE